MVVVGEDECFVIVAHVANHVGERTDDRSAADLLCEGSFDEDAERNAAAGYVMRANGRRTVGSARFRSWG